MMKNKDSTTMSEKLLGILKFINTELKLGEVVTEIHIGDPIGQDDSFGSYPAYLTVHNTVEDKDYEVFFPYCYFSKE